MKGHTRIELHDAKTGELVQAVEDSNMITNALNEIFKPVFGVSIPTVKMMTAGGRPDRYDRFNNNLIGMLMQGLLLFDKALDEDPDLIYKPAGVNNVGAGIDIAYTGTNPFLGSFNVLESQVDFTLGYVRYVWDFNSSQANGTIACACLTTKTGAKCTAGVGAYDPAVVGRWTSTVVASLEAEALSLMGLASGFFALHPWQLGQLNIEPLTTAGRKWLYGSYDDNYVLQLNNPAIFSNNPAIAGSIFQDKAIKIDKYRIPFSNISVFDYLQIAAVDGKYAEKLIDTYTLDMPQELKDLISSSKLTGSYYYPNSMLRDKDHVYFSFFNPVSSGAGTGQLGSYAPGADMLFWDIDLLSMASSVKTVKNTTGEIIQANYQTCYAKSLDAHPIYVLKDYTVVITITGRVYIINNADNTDVKKVTMNGQELIFANPQTDATSGFREGFERNGIFTFTVGFTSNGYGSPLYSLDLETGICSNICTPQAYLYDTQNFARTFGYLEGFKGMCANIGYNNNHVFLCPYFDPSLLMTINNLPEPVVKTSALTMKVTYTLTDGVTA